MEEDGPWEDPHHLRKKDKNRNKDKLNKDNITKFFATNLPQGCTLWEVSEFFKVFGEFVGVYIARKKDKVGNRFGFISFKNVRDVKDMERALSGTKMGSSKLKVNVARFASENLGLFDNDKEKNGRPLDVPMGRNSSQNQIHNHAYINKGGGKLFRDLFASNDAPKVGVVHVQTSGGKVVDVPEDTLAFQDLNGKALVGRCFGLKVLNGLKVVLVEACFSKVSLSYTGGLHVLIKCPSEEVWNSLVGRVDIWSQWFSSLDLWLGQSMPFERIAWLKIIGVPIHLAEDKVFDLIASQFGKVIHASQRSSEDNDLSVNCIGVLVGDGVRIVDQTTLKWKDKTYKVWVEEELADWIPECIEVDEALDDEVLSSQFRLDAEVGPPVENSAAKEDSNGGSSNEVPENHCVHEEVQRLHEEVGGIHGKYDNGGLGNDNHLVNSAEGTLPVDNVDKELQSGGSSIMMLLF
ncbi:putative RNA recognition motif domain, nucleotide-binding alpha-beta plait domain superfamily [Helianthus annuus]|nr:putative RNA recognition motif domain, nucleotide-binding alpha-beta plait domain superfamily [Helianthus annuus]